MDGENVFGMVGIRDDEKIKFELYHYTPSLPAAVAAATIFAILTGLHIWRMFRHRSFYFIAFTVGGALETIGYAGRVQSHFDNKALGGFVTQSLFILIAPALFAASIYMILGRLIRAVRAERLSLIRVSWMTKIFVGGDVVSFFLQAGGGGLQASGSLDNFKIGEKVILGGLFAQIGIFGFFVATTVIFHRRLAREPPTHNANGTPVVPWKRHLSVLYLVSTLILVRNILRVVEYIQGNDGYLISHEIFLYIFDALLMASMMLIIFIFYPGELDRAVRPVDPEDGRVNSSDAMLGYLPSRSYPKP